MLQVNNILVNSAWKYKDKNIFCINELFSSYDVSLNPNWAEHISVSEDLDFFIRLLYKMQCLKVRRISLFSNTPSTLYSEIMLNEISEF